MQTCMMAWKQCAICNQQHLFHEECWRGGCADLWASATRNCAPDFCEHRSCSVLCRLQPTQQECLWGAGRSTDGPEQAKKCLTLPKMRVHAKADSQAEVQMPACLHAACWDSPNAPDRLGHLQPDLRLVGRKAAGETGSTG